MSSPPTVSTGQYLHGAEDLRLSTIKVPAPAPTEVQVAVRSTTLCGSDLHYYQNYRNGGFCVREPLCLGHESSGQVVALGSEVGKINPSLQVGDLVALEVGVACNKCDFCQGERYNLCSQLRFRGSGAKYPHYQGTLQELLNHPAGWVHKLPPQLDSETGALLEPLSVAIHAVRRAERYRVGKSCLILGAGAVGLLCSVAAQASGYKNIVMADIDKGRLQFALENRFASVVLHVKPQRGATIEENLAIARDLAADVARLKWADGKLVGRVQKTFECTGVESCVQTAIYATESGGSILLVGVGAANYMLPLSEVSAREIDLIPTWRYANTYPKAVDIATAAIAGIPYNGVDLPDIKKVITHRFVGLGSIQDAFNAAGKTRDSEGKLVVKTVVNF